MISYDETQIQTAKMLLDGIRVNGWENCKRVVLIRQILDDAKEISDVESSSERDRSRNVHKEKEEYDKPSGRAWSGQRKRPAHYSDGNPDNSESNGGSTADTGSGAADTGVSE